MSAAPDSGAVPGELHRYDLEKKREEVILSGLTNYEISHDAKKILYFTRDAAFQPLSDRIQPGQGKISIDAVEVYMDPRAEWAQMFREAWRIPAHALDRIRLLRFDRGPRQYYMFMSRYPTGLG